MSHPTISRALIVRADNRGSVREAYRASWFPDVPPVVQVVHSESRHWTLRAMHAHKRQFDIWHFTSGEAQVQLFDHRTGEHSSILVGPETTIVIPPGVSHGFYTRSILGVTLTYYLTQEYDGSDEFGWNARDKDFIGAGLWDGPIENMSDRDRYAPSLREFIKAW